MIPLITLLVTFALASFLLRKHTEPTLPGRVALSVMFVVTGLAHFTKTGELAAMIPPVLPAPVAMVYVTGVLELVFSTLLLLRPQAALGWALAAFLVALLPVNIYSAVYETGLGGHGAWYLWFRVPLQVLFILWALVFTGAWRIDSTALRQVLQSRRASSRSGAHGAVASADGGGGARRGQ